MKTFIRRLCLLVGATFICSMVANGQDQTSKLDEPRIPLIQMENVPLSAAIENLAVQAGIGLTIDPKVGAADRPPVSLRWENLTAEEAIARLLKERGLFMVKNPQTSVTKITTTNTPPRVFDKELIQSSKEAIPLIQMQDVPLEIALANLAKTAGLKLEIDAELSSPPRPFNERISVSVRFKNLTAGQAVAAICDQYNLKIVRSETGEVWRVSPGK